MPAAPAATPETPRVPPAVPASAPTAKPAPRTPTAPVTLSSPDTSDTPDTLQALPVAPPPEAPAIPVAAILEPSLASEISRANAKMLSAAVEEMAAAVRATPALAQGEGLLHIQLKADILDGSQIQLSLSGGTLSVQIDAATPDAQVLVERCRPQLEAALAARASAPGGTYHTVHVTVKKGKDDETV